MEILLSQFLLHPADHDRSVASYRDVMGFSRCASSARAGGEGGDSKRKGPVTQWIPVKSSTIPSVE
jgi:hypothetical protein